MLFIKRCLNSIIGTYYLTQNSNVISLNRIGSHPLEDFFGHIRSLCKDFDSYENFINCTVKSYENFIIYISYFKRKVFIVQLIFFI